MHCAETGPTALRSLEHDVKVSLMKVIVSNRRGTLCRVPTLAHHPPLPREGGRRARMGAFAGAKLVSSIALKLAYLTFW